MKKAIWQSVIICVLMATLFLMPINAIMVEEAKVGSCPDSPMTKAASLDSYNYVIITTEGLQEAVKPLVKWRECLGYSVKIITGYTNPDKLRNFLKEKYLEWGIKYVLIVGSIQSIPMKYCYPNPDDHSSNGKVPTDYYYAELTENWDKDGDGYFGEYSDDSLDLLPEVYVGRIPFDTTHKVKSYCQKIVNYEPDNGNWKKSASLLGAIQTYANEDHSGYPKIDCAELTEEFRREILSPKGYLCTTMYEKEGLSPSIYQCDYPLTHSNVLNIWPQGYGIVNWVGHGGPGGAYRKVWEKDNGDGVPESNEIKWYPYIVPGDKVKLNDKRPSIVYAFCCSSSKPEYKGNLGESLIEQGAVAYIGAVRTTWGGGDINYKFLEYLTQNERCGDALYKSKVDYFKGGTHYQYYGVWNVLNMALYGDPALSMFPSNSPPTTPSDPYPENGSGDVYIDVILDWVDCTDPEGTEVSYDVYLKDGEELGEEDLVVSNLTESSYHVTGLKENTHYFWKVVAKDEDGLYREGPIWNFYTVDTDPPAVEITFPKEGYVYLFGRQKIPTLFSGTIIIGEIGIWANAEDNLAVEKIEFYLDDQLKYTDYTPPIGGWDLNEPLLGKHIVKVTAYDKGGNTADDKIMFWAFI